MTREQAKELLEDNFTVINTHGHYTKEEEGQAQELAISALSENKGEWIKLKNGYKCSKCGHIMDKVLSVSGNLIYQYSNYCPECGKKMT